MERGKDTDAPLTLKLRDFGARFIAHHWNHVAPFGEHRTAQAAGLLSKNLGAQAAVLSAIAEFQQQPKLSKKSK